MAKLNFFQESLNLPPLVPRNDNDVTNSTKSTMTLPQFDGHFKKYTIEMKGVSNEQKKAIYPRV